MADQNPTGKGAADLPSPQSQDLRDQAVVLTQVLANWPVHLTLDDLHREIVNDSDSFAEQDGVERAIRDLVGVSLCLRSGAAVLPTRAALPSSSWRRCELCRRRTLRQEPDSAPKPG
jgi:hypothetical protein